MDTPRLDCARGTTVRKVVIRFMLLRLSSEPGSFGGGKVTELSEFAKSSRELTQVIPGTFEDRVKRHDMYYLMVSVIEFDWGSSDELVQSEYMGAPRNRNEQKVMLNLLKFQYEKFGFSWKEHDSKLYRGFEVMDGDRSIAMITAFKAKEEVENG